MIFIYAVWDIHNKEIMHNVLHRYTKQQRHLHILFVGTNIILMMGETGDVG